MKQLPASLTPFVRSDAVGALLAELFTQPDQELTLSELARRADVSLPVTHREVSRLVESGVLRDRIEGRNRLVVANQEHPLFSLMRQLIDATYGPVPVLRDAFHGVVGVHEVIIYGSWAARRSGEPGEFPRDLDVLVVGDVTRRRLAEIAAASGTQLGLPVNITRVSPEEWAGADTPFLQTLRSRPTIVVTDAAHD